MSLGRRSLCGNGKSLCDNGKPSVGFETPKFIPKTRIKEIIRNHRLCDKIIFLNINNFLAQQETNQYLIVPHLVVTPNGRSKLSTTDNHHRLLKQDTKNQRIDVANNPHLALSSKALKQLYTEVPAAPDNIADKVVIIPTIYGAKLE
jgi:hypothetical protein